MRLSEGFLSIDEHGMIRAIDPFAQAITGFTPEEVVGRNVALLVRRGVGETHDFDVATLGPGHAVLVGAEPPVAWQTRHGREMDVTITPGKERSGLLSLFAVSVRLRVPNEDNDERMADLFQHASAAMHSADAAGRIELVNDAWLRMMGYQRDEVVGRLSRDFVCDPDAWERTIAALRTNGFVRGAELLARRKDGTVISILVDSTAATDEHGVAYTRTMIRDITEIRSIERTMRLQVHGQAAGVVAQTLGGRHASVIELIGRAGDADAVGIWLPDGARGVLRVGPRWFAPRLRGSSFERATGVISFARGVGLPGRVWQSGTPVVISDLRFDSNYLRQREAGEAGLVGAAAFPLRRDDETLGVIDFYSDEVMIGDDNVLRELSRLGETLGPLM